MEHACKLPQSKNFKKKLVDAKKNEIFNDFFIQLATPKVLHNKWEVLDFDEERPLTLERWNRSFWPIFIFVLDFLFLIIEIRWLNLLTFANITGVYSMHILEVKAFYFWRPEQVYLETRMGQIDPLYFSIAKNVPSIHLHVSKKFQEIG